MQVASHFTQDKGLRDEGFHHSYSHQENSFANARPDQLLDEFWEHTLGNMQQAFRMDNLLAEMRDIEASSLRPKPQQSAPISLLAQQEDASEWANQFLKSGSHFENTPHPETIWHNAPVLRGDAPIPEQPNDFQQGWREEFLRSSETWLDNTQEELSNLRALSEDYSAEAAKESSGGDELRKSAQESVESLQANPDMHQSKLLKFMSGVATDGAPVISESDVATASQWGSEYQSSRINQLNQEWESEFLTQNRITGSTPSTSVVPGKSATDKTDLPLWNELNSHWKEMADSLGSESLSNQWFSDYSRTQRSKEYNFAEDNPMQNEANAFALGQEKLRQGDIPSAILYFEAAARQEPENAEIWLVLGISLGENEQDPQAIAALNKCLSIEPKNLNALMTLSICYTNEGCLHGALDTLKEWILNNEKYESSCRNINIPNPSEVPTMQIHQQVLSCYLNAARQNPTQSIDPDVQNGLGVLFNLSDEYDKAVDCFKAALQVRPEDSRLWNRLGASLANGSRPEEAVDAYDRALQLNPGFVRARYNLGITCVHLGATSQAVEHFLTALNQQAAAHDGQSSQGLSAPRSVKEMSDSIWYSLRVVLSVMNRTDLHHCFTSRDLATLNKEFGIL